MFWLRADVRRVNLPAIVLLSIALLLLTVTDGLATTIFVTNQATVLRVDPVTGRQTTMSSGGYLMNPESGIAVTRKGEILVADPAANAVIRIDRTDVQTVVSSGGIMLDPVAIAIAQNGDILVADPSVQAVIRIDPVTGAQTSISSGGHFRSPFGVAVAPRGDIFVVDVTAFDGHGGVIRVDRRTGAQSEVSSGGLFQRPTGIAMAPNCDIYIADDHFGEGVIFRVDPATGVQTFISGGGLFMEPLTVAVSPDGRDIFVLDRDALDPLGIGGRGAIIRVDPVTGVQTLLSSGGVFSQPFGIAVTARNPEWFDRHRSGDVAAMPAVEDGDPLAGTVLSQAHLKALVRHTDDDEADAGPGVEPPMHESQLRGVGADQHCGQRRAQPLAPRI